MGTKQKKLLRSEMKRIVTHLDPRWVHAASNEVSTHLVRLLDQLPIEVEHILAWASFFPGELDLSRLIEQSLGQYQIYLPRVLEDATMTFVSIGQNWHDDVQPGPSGVLEPLEDGGHLYQVEWAPNTVVLVPGLAFNERGDRLGRGKGCYDRFFSRPGMSDAIKVGTCFSIQMTEQIPIESYDAVMDWVCTEEGYFQSILEENGFSLPPIKEQAMGMSKSRKS